jgi:hypothetical protein
MISQLNGGRDSKKDHKDYLLKKEKKVENLNSGLFAKIWTSKNISLSKYGKS